MAITIDPALTPLKDPNDFVEVPLYSSLEDRVDDLAGNIQVETKAIKTDPERYSLLSANQFIASLIISIGAVAIGIILLVGFNRNAVAVYTGCALTICGAAVTGATILYEDSQNQG